MWSLIDRIGSLVLNFPADHPAIIFLVVGLSRDDALTVVRREAFIPAHSALARRDFVYSERTNSFQRLN